jgi:hypothetical protein
VRNERTLIPKKEMVNISLIGVFIERRAAAGG